MTAPVVVTLLVTAVENGYLLPTASDGKSKGGAGETLAKWVSDEHHCAGALGPKGAPACAEDATIALSAGDHWSGPAISSYFGGESTAETMAKMGYAASAPGNHEFDFGRPQFVKNQKLGGFPFVAANWKVKDEHAAGTDFPPFVIIERKGAKIGVVGLASVTTSATAMSGRYEGIEFTGYEESLGKAIPAAYAAGADAVVVLAHECPSELTAVVAKNADWKPALVTGAHCREPFSKKEGDTSFASPGKHWEQYLRVSLTVDTSRPVHERVVAVDSKLVDVGGGIEPQPGVAKTIAAWKQKLDAALGEEIGFTKAGIDQKSPAMARWITNAWKDMLGVDVAISNKNGIRQSLPPGKITKSSVHSVLPFENTLLTLSIKGDDLIKDLGNEQAIYSGVVKTGKDQYKDATGKPIDPQRRYSVATVEYLYFGGEGFAFEKQDPLPRETGMIWQTPVIDWTKKQGLSAAQPLEQKLK